MTTLTHRIHAKERQPRALSNFMVRFLTALALIPLGIAGMYLGGWFPWLWALMLVPLGVVGGLEFYSLAHGRPQQSIASVGVPAILGLMLGFYLQSPPVWITVLALVLIVTPLVAYRLHGDGSRLVGQTKTTLAGVIYFGFPLGFLIAAQYLENPFLWLVVIFSLTWGTDTFAYAGGRMWGKRPLAPRLSPKKTVEGALVGIVGGILPALVFLLRADALTGTVMVMVVLGPLVAIAGDLLESAIKRHYKVKDSHLHGLNVIPGHGGVMDRIDALLVVSAFCYLFIVLTGLA